MILDQILEAEIEAKRFMKKLTIAKQKFEKDKYASFGCKEAAALKRSSTDLSRALSDLRR